MDDITIGYEIEMHIGIRDNVNSVPEKGKKYFKITSNVSSEVAWYVSLDLDTTDFTIEGRYEYYNKLEFISEVFSKSTVSKMGFDGMQAPNIFLNKLLELISEYPNNNDAIYMSRKTLIILNDDTSVQNIVAFINFEKGDQFDLNTDHDIIWTCECISSCTFIFSGWEENQDFLDLPKKSTTAVCTQSSIAFDDVKHLPALIDACMSTEIGCILENSWCQGQNSQKERIGFFSSPAFIYLFTLFPSMINHKESSYTLEFLRFMVNVGSSLDLDAPCLFKNRYLLMPRVHIPLITDCNVTLSNLISYLYLTNEKPKYPIYGGRQNCYYEEVTHEDRTKLYSNYDDEIRKENRIWEMGAKYILSAVKSPDRTNMLKKISTPNVNLIFMYYDTEFFTLPLFSTGYDSLGAYDNKQFSKKYFFEYRWMNTLLNQLNTWTKEDQKILFENSILMLQDEDIALKSIDKRNKKKNFQMQKKYLE
jgi:hypothetical protein